MHQVVDAAAGEAAAGPHAGVGFLAGFGEREDVEIEEGL